MRFPLNWIVLVAVVGCAEGNDAVDARPCVLGTASDCGTCGNACPGVDDDKTLRICTTNTAAGQCDISCRGEFYDVDGSSANGCEALDPPPVQDTAATAVVITLPNATGGTGTCGSSTNPCTATSVIFSDTRPHEVPPVVRTLGREDWFRVTAIGTGTPNTMAACLNIANYPADNMYRVCISDQGSMTATTCGVATGGGASACVSPTGMTDAGTYYVVVKKLAGAHTWNLYALYLEH